MRKAIVNRLLCAACAVLILLTGCGGGGGAPAAPPDEEPPPTVEIGDGPGPAIEPLPTEPAIDTTAARHVAFADDPSLADVRTEALARIDGFADDPPDSEQQLRAVLADFTGWATRRPNDAVSQAGLAWAITLAGLYNAGIDAGYATSDLLALLEPVTHVASASADTAPGDGFERRMLELCMPAAPLRSSGRMQTAADWPDLNDPDFSTVELQLGLRRFALPTIDHAVERLQAVISGVSGARDPLAEVEGGARRAYMAEVRALVALLEMARGAMLQACGYQLNAGGWDWTVDLADRDEDGDGLLTVDEYLPGDPFGWRHQSSTFRDGGRAMRRALDVMVKAIGQRQPDSLLAKWVGDDAGAAERVRFLEDLRALITDRVVVTITTEGPGGPSVTAPMRLGRMYDAPVDDLKEFMPALQPVSGSVWEALPRNVGDFPDPTFNGIFPNEPGPIINIICSGPRYVAISYGEIDEFVLLDRR